VIVNAYGGFLRQKLYATIYSLARPDRTRLMDSLAAAQAAHRDSIRDIAVVHIKDYDDMGRRYIWFHRSLVDSIKGLGFDGLRGAGRKFVSRHSQIQRLALTDKTHFDHHSMVFEKTKLSTSP
jgi:hypothetical protein